MKAALRRIDARIPIYAPTGRDAALIRDVLDSAYLFPALCRHIGEFCAMIGEGAGAAIVAEEALDGAVFAPLQRALAAQPAWSDLPVIILRAARRRAGPYDLLPNAVYLDRPLRKAALIAAVRVALRARQRQYEIRAYVRERDENARALKESEARFRGTFDNAAVGMAHVGADGSWLRVNQRLCDLVGYSREELLSGGFQNITHPDDLAHDLRLFDLLMRGKIDRYRIEKRYFHKDGRVIWIDLTTALQRDEHGKPLYCIAVIVDITKRKAAEAELKESEATQRRLTAEVDHRAKNLLAVVQAMARLSARYAASPEGFLDAFQERIRALALTHNALSETRWQGASLRQIVGAEIGAFDSEGRVTLTGEDVMLKAKTAQDLTMALHELATNATKYGALSTPQGRLAIAWRPADSGGLILDWRESGGPPVRQPSRTGFGSLVIGNAAGYDGSVDYRFDPEGVRCRIELPADALVGDDGGRQSADPLWSWT